MYEESAVKTREEILASVAKDLLISLDERFSEVEVRVSYFGKGQRFSLKYLPENKLRITLYFHETTTADFGEVIQSASAAALNFFDKKTSIRISLAQKLIESTNVHTTFFSEEDKKEMLEILSIGRI